MIAGPAVGGIIIAEIGVAWAYALDAMTFVGVIVALMLIRSRQIMTSTAQGGFAAAVEGLRFLRSSPILLSVMAIDFLATFFGAVTVLMPVFAEQILRVGPRGLGILLSAPAVGAVLGSIVMGALPVTRRPGLGVMMAVAGYGLCIIGFGSSRNFGLSLLFLAGAGSFDAVSMALRHTVRNLATPDGLRGRIAAVHSTFAAGGPQLGEFQAGLMASLIGPGSSVALGGAGIIVTVLAIATRVPGIRRYRLSDQLNDAESGEGECDSQQRRSSPGTEPSAASAADARRSVQVSPLADGSPNGYHND